MTQHNDSWEWLDDIIKRWPVITGILGLILWLTALQFKQEALAQSVHDVPGIKTSIQTLEKKIDNLNESFKALTESLGYEIKLKAVKKDTVIIGRLVKE